MGQQQQAPVMRTVRRSQQQPAAVTVRGQGCLLQFKMQVL
jgi:hypothetical protein